MTFKFFGTSRIREVWEYRVEPEAQRTLAAVFWRALLCCAFVALVTALWFGSQELGAASQAESVQSVAASPHQPFDPMQLQNALDAFAVRQIGYRTLSQSPLPAVADPSK